MTVRMRHTRAHTRNRRSHHALKEPALTVCQDCKEYHLRHKLCQSCGRYRGRMVIDMAEKVAKRQQRIADKKKALGQEKKNDDEDEKTHPQHKHDLDHEHDIKDKKPLKSKGFLPKILKPRVEGGGKV